MAINTCTFLGRLTKDVELRYTNSEKPVASFTIAVDRMRDGCDFIPCVAWEKTATFIDQYFKKGSPIAVNGEMRCRDWQDKEGKKRTSIECLITRASFCGDKKAATGEIRPEATFSELPDDDGGELPF